MTSEKQSALYKYLIAIPLAIFDGNFYAVWILQFAFGCATAALLFAIAKRAFGPVVAIVAGLWYAVYGPAIFLESQILRESLSCFFIALSIYFLMRVGEGRKWLYWLAVALSLGMQNRPNSLLIIPFVVGYLWLIEFSSDEKSARIKKLAAFMGVFVATSIPLLIRTLIVHGRFVFYDMSGPFTMLLGNLPDYVGLGWAPSPKYVALVNEAGGEYAISWSDALRALFSEWKLAPFYPLSLYARKIFWLFNSYECSSNLNYYLFGEMSFILRGPWSRFSPIGALGIVGMAVGLSRKHRKNSAPTAVVLAGTFASIVFFYNVDRFRMLLVPALTVFAAFAIVEIVGYARGASWRSLALSIVTTAALLYASEATKPFPGDVRPEDYNNTGWAYLENESRRDTGKAEKYLILSWNESVRWNYPVNRAGKTLGPLERLLADAYTKSGDPMSALERIGRAKLADPCDPATRRSEAAAWRAIGQEDRAIRAEDDAAKLEAVSTAEESVTMAYAYINSSDLPGAYCHLFAAAVAETDPDKKKLYQEQAAELFSQLNRTPMKEK